MSCPCFFNIPRIYYILRNLAHFVSSYHRITLHYVIILTSYHRIIVSRKNIPCPGFFNIPRIYYILRNLAHFVSSYHRITKKYTLPRLLLILAYITLRNYFDFVSSYHEKIYLAQASLIYLGFIIYYVIILTSYHRIIVSRKNIPCPGFFNIPRIYYILRNLAHFVSSYHRITKKYTLPRLLLIIAYITLRNYFDFVSSYHRITKKYTLPRLL